ncbi:hypothetical protein [Nostoc sp. CHAB 5715]|uniref:hypothetical protein n=1 Tax=Nostoc sp. CHAB 5715 TaxID=2780400 RepID=UPI001E63D3C1|nr:hypothetical protein [Nostoc sp. CHAB 5715]MCC5620894.1 hypothetical protein [Nostoc sp. CHAB 5715]
MTKSTFLISIYILYIYLQFCRHRYPTSEWGVGSGEWGVGNGKWGIGHCTEDE